MYSLFKKEYKINKTQELNEFVSKILDLGENYLEFLISKNIVYLPEHVSSKDAAVDLLAELFLTENNTLIKFKKFFQNNFHKDEITSEDKFNKYLRAFVYTIIQNNLLNIYKENDPCTYNIYRNLKETIKSLNLLTSNHFSGKYIHKCPEISFDRNVPEKEDLVSIIYSNGLGKMVFNLVNFVKTLLDILEKSDAFTPAMRLNDLVCVIKSIFAYEYITKDGASSESEHITEKANIKFMLDDVKFTFIEKLNRYISKNNQSKNFSECMYNIIDEVIEDLKSGNTRQSVMKLMKTYFKSTDKNLFYKVQYCIELFESEIVKYYEKEKHSIV